MNTETNVAGLPGEWLAAPDVSSSRIAEVMVRQITLIPRPERFDLR